MINLLLVIFGFLFFTSLIFKPPVCKSDGWYITNWTILTAKVIAFLILIKIVF